jgi:hypothetical protein
MQDAGCGGFCLTVAYDAYAKGYGMNERLTAYPEVKKQNFSSYLSRRS